MNFRAKNASILSVAAFALASAVGCSSSDDVKENQDAGSQQEAGAGIDASSDDANGNQDVGSQQEAGAGTGVDFTLDFAAVDHYAGGDNKYKAQVRYDAVSECVYKRTDKWLTVTLRGGQTNNATVSLTSFTGKGDYMAAGDNSTNSSVFFQVLFTSLTTGMDDGVITIGTWAADSQKSDPCAIKVLESNLNEVEVTGAEGSGAVRMQVTCKSLGGAQLGRVDATMVPDTFSFSVGDCTVYP